MTSVIGRKMIKQFAEHLAQFRGRYHGTKLASNRLNPGSSLLVREGSRWDDLIERFQRWPFPVAVAAMSVAGALAVIAAISIAVSSGARSPSRIRMLFL